MNYHTEDPWWDKLLTGRSADVILTADAPAFYDQLAYGSPARNQVSKLVLQFSGVKPVRVLQFGSVKAANEDKIEKWPGKRRTVADTKPPAGRAGDHKFARCPLIMSVPSRTRHPAFPKPSYSTKLIAYPRGAGAPAEMRYADLSTL